MLTPPAVVIGGPPHAGKSVLAHALSRALRAHHVAHYLLRAVPDGEGDWAQEANGALVQHMRVKGTYTDALITQFYDALVTRQLPLLVDIGGLPTIPQEVLFDACTHALVLTRSADERAEWLARVARHAPPLIADLHSDLHGADSLHARAPILRGVLAGLTRQRTTLPHGPTFDALVDALATLFTPDAARPHHLATAPPNAHLIDLDALARTLAHPDLRWHPTDVPRVLATLPCAAPYALYGRAPNWLYAACALHAPEAAFYQFDARLGWLTPPRLRFGPVRADAPFSVAVTAAGAVSIACTLPATLLDYAAAQDLCVPDVPAHCGVILGGKLPHWLITALARQYRAAPWVAVYQPQCDGAVVVAARAVGAPEVGACVRGV